MPSPSARALSSAGVSSNVKIAAWSPRAYHQAVVLNEKIYVFGGGNYTPAYHAKNDVWSSGDGVTWTCETQAAPWEPRLWFSAAVYRANVGGVKRPARRFDASGLDTSTASRCQALGVGVVPTGEGQLDEPLIPA